MSFLVYKGVSAVELAIMEDRCLPCTGYNYDYCMDDPNLVNLNGKKCYTKREDKAQYCANFTFLHNPVLCDTVNLTVSTVCDQFTVENMKYGQL